MPQCAAASIVAHGHGVLAELGVTAHVCQAQPRAMLVVQAWQGVMPAWCGSPRSRCGVPAAAGNTHAAHAIGPGRRAGRRPHRSVAAPPHQRPTSTKHTPLTATAPRGACPRIARHNCRRTLNRRKVTPRPWRLALALVRTTNAPNTHSPPARVAHSTTTGACTARRTQRRNSTGARRCNYTRRRRTP